MLFPSRREYRAWFERAGFADVSSHALAPDWYRDRRGPYAVAVARRQAGAGPSPLALRPARAARGAAGAASGCASPARFVARLAGRRRVRADRRVALRCARAGERR